MKNIIKKFLREEDGVAAIEYALLAGLIAVAIIVTVQNMTGNLETMFNKIGSSLTSAAA
ncbi:Flp family type IVb pilin [Paraburkholderia phytofirmans]|uniref:Flp family type IVb pilin n=1 Tax=Paraburkholderia phytofirmans TaxID=261302 RepID=UPI0038B8FD5D